MQLSYLAEDGGAVIDIVQNGTMRTEILAARIISNHLDLLGKNQMKQLARVCSCNLEEVLLAAARIRELNPKPGSGYGDESYDKYIVTRYNLLPRRNTDLKCSFPMRHCRRLPSIRIICH
mgnify:CR=1 FL=1